MIYQFTHLLFSLLVMVFRSTAVKPGEGSNVTVSRNMCVGVAFCI